MTPSPAPPQSHGPLLPVAAMILSVIGLCFPPLLLVTFALGLLGYLKGRTNPVWALRKQVTQMTMAVSFAGLLIFVGLFLPNFKRYQLRVKQVECRETLVSLHDAQARLYAKEKRYTPKLDELDWKPPRGRSIVRLSAEGALEEFGQGVDEARFTSVLSKELDEAVPKLVRAEVGIHGECPACSVTMSCASQLDSDPQVDVWTISTLERMGNQGEKIPGGIAWCEVDDVTQ